MRPSSVSMLGCSRTLSTGKTALVKRAGGVGVAIALVCLIAWALAPRGFFFGRESGRSGTYHPPTPAPVNHAAPAAGRRQPGTAEARRSRFPAGNQRTGDPEYLRGPAGQAAHSRTAAASAPDTEWCHRRSGAAGETASSAPSEDWASYGTGCGTTTASTTRD